MIASAVSSRNDSNISHPSPLVIPTGAQRSGEICGSPSAFSNPSSEAIPDEPSPPNQALTPQPEFAMADCCIRLANKINAARLTNSVIWTALAGSSPGRSPGRQSWVNLPSTRMLSGNPSMPT
jgi:hypothetical protein